MEIDVSKLTDKHRLVLKNRENPDSKPFEVGLYLTDLGWLVGDMGWPVRRSDGRQGDSFKEMFDILEVIEPPFEPKWGDVYGAPTPTSGHRAVYLPYGDKDTRPWLTSVPGNTGRYWLETARIEGLIRDHGWVKIEAPDED